MNHKALGTNMEYRKYCHNMNGTSVKQIERRYRMMV